jgi:OFA family oxalate/formate antiporter-like MFS transporter
MEQEQQQQTETKGGKGFYKGWQIVIISGLFQVMFAGLYHTGLSVYFLPLIRTFGVSHTKMSFAFSVRSLEGGIEGPLTGYLVDRLGPRLVVIAGVIVGGVCFILLGLTQSYISFLLVFLGVGMGVSAGSHGLMATINFWFRRRLGIAMSMASTGSAIGSFLLVPLVAWIVLNYSWRTTAILSGGMVLAIGLPLAFLMHNPQGDEAAIEEMPSGSAERAHDHGGMEHVSEHSDSTTTANFNGDFTVREALRTKVFWILSLAIGLRLMAQTALTVHMVPMLVSKDIGEGAAAILVSLSALVRLPGVIGAGLLADKWSRSKMSSMAMVSGFAAAVYIISGPSGLLTCTVFVILFAGAESCNSVTWALIGEFFGRRNFGSLRGIITLLQSLMSFSGPIMAGFVYDTSGSYKIVFIVIGAIYALSAVLHWVMRAPAVLKLKESSPVAPA